MDYQNRLATKIAEKAEFEQRQRDLRRKYQVKEDGVIQVVKKRWIEIIIKNTVSLFKTALGILHILLSTIGGISLLYPETRDGLYNLFLDLCAQAVKLIGM